jgi:hypothetical protein
VDILRLLFRSRLAIEARPKGERRMVVNQDRTGDLMNAIHALQLRYWPMPPRGDH